MTTTSRKPCEHLNCSTLVLGHGNVKYCCQNHRNKHLAWRHRRGIQLLDALIAGDAKKLLQTREAIFADIEKGRQSCPTPLS